MFVPAIVALLAVFLTYLTRFRQNGFGLKLAFVVIFVFLALRYDYGNDYMGYLDGFHYIAGQTQVTAITEERWEPGWNLLCFMFKPFGFFVMVWFTSLATCVVMYRFIRDYVPSTYQWLAVFLYAFDPYQLLVPASAMRQNISILLFLVAMKYLYQKKVIIYLVLSIAAAMFHKSGFVLLPLVLLAYTNFRINRLLACGFILLYTSLFWFGAEIFSRVAPWVEAYFPKYAEYYLYGLRTEFNSGLGFVYALFQLTAVLYFAGLEMKSHDGEPATDESPAYYDVPDVAELSPSDPLGLYHDIAARRLLFKLAIMTFIFTPLGLQVLMISRINMYFVPIMIAIYPLILYTTRSRFFHLIFLWSLIPFTLFRFWTFFLSPVWRDKFGSYHTIFSSPRWY